MERAWHQRFRSRSNDRVRFRCISRLPRPSKRPSSDGELKPGDRFENELALARRLNLSRPTTRRAIQELVDKGMLVRKRGVGTQVVQNPGASPGGTDQSVRRSGPGRAGTGHQSARLSDRAGVGRDRRRAQPAHGHEVVTMRRLRMSGGQPLALMTNNLPAALAPDQAELEAAGSTRHCGPAACTSGWPASASGQVGGQGRGTAARREAQGAAAGDEPHRL